METTSIYTPTGLKGNQYHIVKNNGLLTILEVGPRVSNISIKAETALAPEILEISTAELVSGILFNRLVFAGRESDREENARINEQVQRDAPYGMKPGHRYIKLGARNAVLKGGAQDVKLPDSEAKPTRPVVGLKICTVQPKEDRIWNTLRIKGEIEDDVFITVDEEFVGFHFTSRKTGNDLTVTAVDTKNIYLDGQAFTLWNFIQAVQQDRLVPCKDFWAKYDEAKEELDRRNAEIEDFERGLEDHFAYFDEGIEPKDFGTDESAYATGFQWVHPRQKPAAESKRPTIANRLDGPSSMAIADYIKMLDEKYPTPNM